MLSVSVMMWVSSLTGDSHGVENKTILPKPDRRAGGIDNPVDAGTGIGAR